MSYIVKHPENHFFTFDINAVKSSDIKGRSGEWTTFFLLGMMPYKIRWNRAHFEINICGQIDVTVVPTFRDVKNHLLRMRK